MLRGSAVISGPPIITVNGIVADGDSITLGNVSGPPTYPTYLGSISGFTVANTGTGGQTYAQMVTSYPLSGHPGTLYNSAGPNTLIILGGANDLLAGSTAAQVEASLISYCNEAVATGWQIMVATVLPGTAYTGSAETNRIALNTWIRANYRLYASRLVDFDVISVFNPPAFGNAYFVEGLHPTTLGNQYMAAAALAAASLSGIPQSNTVLPAITGHVQTGNALTASTGTWTDYLTPTYTYQWFKDGSAIGGATASSYTVLAGDVGHSITVQVTDTSLYAVVSATSAAASP